jgi:anti-sigma factor RsiW
MTTERRPGPAECRQIEALLPPFVDGQSGPGEHAQVAAHLAHCDACQRAADVQATVRRLLHDRRAALCGVAPAGLAAQVRTASLPASILDRRGRLSALAAAAGIVLAVTGAFVWTTGRSSVLLAAQLTLDHIKCFMIDGDDHAPAFTAAGAEARMQQDFGWSVPVPTPAARPDVHLVAVRRCLYGEGMVAHVLYRIEGEPVSLFVMPDRAAAPADLSSFGRHAEVLTRRGATYVLVAPARLRGVAAAVGLEAQ